MNRSQARIRVDQLLDWQSDEMRTGKCPLCGVFAESLGVPPDEWVTENAPKLGMDTVQERGFAGYRFLHEDDCQLADVTAKVTQLCQEFGFRLENVLVSVVIDNKEQTVRTLRRIADEQG